jgi:hypothetical protein
LRKTTTGDFEQRLEGRSSTVFEEVSFGFEGVGKRYFNETNDILKIVLLTNAKHLGKYAKLGPRISVITSKRMSPFKKYEY